MAVSELLDGGARCKDNLWKPESGSPQTRIGNIAIPTIMPRTFAYLPSAGPNMSASRAATGISAS